MSEALFGVPPAPPPVKARAAAAVILYRRVAGGAEVFWLKREKTLRFAGGFYAFPGGKLDKADALVPVVGAEGEAAALIVAAARELFEESGVLKARGAVPAQATLDDLRGALLAETVGFGELLTRHGLSVHAEDFPFAGRWVTPKWFPVRFDARFFLVEAPADQQACVWPGELESGEWTLPSRALEAWERGTVLLHPPNLHALQVMNRFTSPQQALAELPTSRYLDEDFISYCIEFQRGVLVYPMPTPTLPPATHTNTYILGTKQCLIVDPGSPDEAETNKLISFVRELGYQPMAVVLTHQHLDHVGGAQHVAHALGIPIWAHRLTAAELPELKIARFLDEGDELRLEGPLPTTWRVLHTPGHARGHLCLVNEATRLGVVGDMVSGVSTIIIDPPEGDMGEYLRQLERLKLHLATLCPAHGALSPDAVAKLDEYLLHRAWREQKVVDALASFTEPVTVEALTTKAYDDVMAFVLPIAERNTTAILHKLRGEGRAVEVGGAWRGR